MTKTTLVKLADEQEYKLSALNVGDLIELENKFGSLEIDTKKLENIMYYLWLSLRKNQPELELKQLYELVDAPFIANNGLSTIFEIMAKLNGWDKSSKNEVSLVEGKKEKV